jgi:O-acetyl-ADP-ribose deacetylase (regulator of RNase III)
MNKQEYENNIINTYYELMQKCKNNNNNDDIIEIRKIIKNYLTTNTNKLNENIHNKINKILQYELSQKNITNYILIPDIRIYNSSIRLWKGDITTLKIDCIVNAANDKGLGCFQIDHKCIDNVIHLKAGPKLREECEMILKGNKIKTGNLIVTSGYNLPTKYIFHVVGPIYDSKKANLNKFKLMESYLNCLSEAKKRNIKSITFCCISTGVFGFPKHNAVDIAITTVIEWIKHNKDFSIDVVFCVYTDQDEKLYREYLKKLKYL